MCLIPCKFLKSRGIFQFFAPLCMPSMMLAQSRQWQEWVGVEVEKRVMFTCEAGKYSQDMELPISFDEKHDRSISWPLRLTQQGVTRTGARSS